MTTDTRTPDEIERDIERDRAELTGSLETLQDRFSVDGVMQSVGDQIRDHGGEFGASISRTVKENPAAVALTGIGLAWLILGKKSSRSDKRHAEQGARRDHGEARYGQSVVSRPDPRFKGGEVGVPHWARDDDDDDEEGIAGRVADAASSARDGVAETASSARDSLSDAAASAREKAADSARAISSKAADASNAAKDMARSSRERAARMRERLAEGTETLSEEARARVVAAREAAVDARRKAAAGAEKASDFYDSQPLVVGALALAVGAAIGGALPRTRKEDDLMGARSDDLTRQAEEIFQEEMEKAKAVMTAAKDEAKAVAKEKRAELDKGAPGDKTAAEAVADEARSSGKRVADAAEKKADEKGLGKVSS